MGNSISKKHAVKIDPKVGYAMPTFGIKFIHDGYFAPLSSCKILKRRWNIQTKKVLSWQKDDFRKIDILTIQ